MPKTTAGIGNSGTWRSGQLVVSVQPISDHGGIGPDMRELVVPCSQDESSLAQIVGGLIADAVFDWQHVPDADSDSEGVVAVDVTAFWRVNPKKRSEDAN